MFAHITSFFGDTVVGHLLAGRKSFRKENTDRYVHTYKYIYIYAYIYTHTRKNK